MPPRTDYLVNFCFISMMSGHNTLAYCPLWLPARPKTSTLRSQLSYRLLNGRKTHFSSRRCCSTVARRCSRRCHALDALELERRCVLQPRSTVPTAPALKSVITSFSTQLCTITYRIVAVSSILYVLPQFVGWI